MLITKIGLDGHDRGSRIVASYLRDAGLEVIYTPPWQSIEAVVNLARQEDVNGASVRYLNRLSDLLFVVARVLARADGGKEVIWIHGDQR